MTKEIKKEIKEILDNVRYWESCPADYKTRIKTILDVLKYPSIESVDFKSWLYSEGYKKEPCTFYYYKLNNAYSKTSLYKHYCNVLDSQLQTKLKEK